MIVADPLRPGSALSFSQISHGGDTYSVPSFPPGSYSLAFDYLGLARTGSQPGDLGGFVGIGGCGPRWVLGTTCIGAESCVLIDDGRWHNYVIRFQSTSAFDFVLEDWDGFTTTRPPGVAGDVFFDNVELRVDQSYGTITFGESSPGCTGGVGISTNGTPRVGTAGFALTCANAPSNAAGVLLLTADALTLTPIPLLGLSIWLDPTGPWSIWAGATSNATGAASVPLPIPPTNSVSGLKLYGQFAWVGPASPPPCPPTGLSASNAIEVTVQR